MGLLTAGLCFTVGVAILYGSWLTLQTRNRILTDWIRLDDAVVVESKVSSGRWPCPLVVYEYHSADVYYLGQDSPSMGFPLSARLAERIAERYLPGTVVTIYVNPEDHRVSVLQLPPPWLCFGGLLAGATCFCLGGAQLLYQLFW